MYISIIIVLAILTVMATVVDTLPAIAGRRDLNQEERESVMYQDNGYVKSQSNRPAINPDFDPDRSCLFDTFQLRCIPGSQQECPEGFGAGDPETCFAETFINGKWEWQCPKDYHTIDDDETGQCYPNSEGCPDAMILLTDRHDKIWDRCAEFEHTCYSSDLQNFSCRIADPFKCEHNQNHPYCNGTKGLRGSIFCELLPSHIKMSCFDKRLAN